MGVEVKPQTGEAGHHLLYIFGIQGFPFVQKGFHAYAVHAHPLGEVVIAAQEILRGLYFLRAEGEQEAHKGQKKEKAFHRISILIRLFLG